MDLSLVLPFNLGKEASLGMKLNRQELLCPCLKTFQHLSKKSVYKHTHTRIDMDTHLTHINTQTHTHTCTDTYKRKDTDTQRQECMHTCTVEMKERGKKREHSQPRWQEPECQALSGKRLSASSPHHVEEQKYREQEISECHP